jgi:hypothetical protein
VRHRSGCRQTAAFLRQKKVAALCREAATLFSLDNDFSQTCNSPRETGQGKACGDQAGQSEGRWPHTTGEKALINMPKPVTYEDIWIRFIHFTWQHRDDWRTGIPYSVLNSEKIKDALFVLDDRSCVFIPLEELRRILSGRPPYKNGSINIGINPHLKTAEKTLLKCKL